MVRERERNGYGVNGISFGIYTNDLITYRVIIWRKNFSQLSYSIERYFFGHLCCPLLLPQHYHYQVPSSFLEGLFAVNCISNIFLLNEGQASLYIYINYVSGIYAYYFRNIIFTSRAKCVFIS